MTKYTCINCQCNRRCIFEVRGDVPDHPPSKCPFGMIDYHNNDDDNSQWERTE